MLHALKQVVRRRIRDRRETDSSPLETVTSFQDGWAAEREYWLEIMREFYRSEYNLELHNAQTDTSMIPPLEIVSKIQGTNKADPNAFFATGYRTALAYQTELRDYHSPPHQMQNILEMGVGMGRVILHYFPFEANLYGCDVTPEALSWTRLKLGHRVSLELTDVKPPLPYPDGLFDFVYANSVFTHVPCAFMSDWVAELRRIIRPGGMLILSVLDPNHYLRDMTYREFHQRYQAAGCFDWNQDQGVRMVTYLSRDFLYATWSKHFHVLELRSHYREQSHFICRRDL